MESQRTAFRGVARVAAGDRDNLVGDPEAARDSVQDIPDVRVEVVNAGHLMGAELSAQVNESILAFFAQD